MKHSYYLGSKTIIRPIALVFLLVTIGFTAALTSQTSLDSCTPLFTIKNEGTCGVALYLNEDYMKDIEPGTYWSGAGAPGDIWTAVSKINYRWSESYTVTSECLQIFEFAPNCEIPCEIDFDIANRGECDLKIYRNGSFFRTLSSKITWQGTTEPNDIWVTKTSSNPNWSSTYTATEDCEQIFRIEAECSVQAVCQPYIYIRNNGLCDVKLYHNNKFKQILLVGHQWGGPTSPNHIWTATSSDQGSWSYTYKTTTDCSQLIILDPFCTPDPCTPNLSIFNDGICDIKLLQNGDYMKTLQPGQQWGGEATVGDVWESVSIDNPNWSQSYSVTDECNQTVYFDTDCNNVGCQDINSTSFEEGWGIWVDGGHDAHRLKHTINANTGSYSIKLKDNSGDASSIYTQPLQLEGYNKINITFKAISQGFDDGEDFFVEISLDGGHTFNSYARHVHGTHFFNNQRINYYVGMSAALTDQIIVRIRTDASSNYDVLYIDDVKIEACYIDNTQSRSNNNNVTMSAELDETVSIDFDLELLSNVIHDQLAVKISDKGDQKINLSIIRANGQVQYNRNLTSGNSGVLEIKTDGLTPGMYFLRAVDQNGTLITKRFIKQ